VQRVAQLRWDAPESAGVSLARPGVEVKGMDQSSKWKRATAAV
jgi:hypothetical protein